MTLFFQQILDGITSGVLYAAMALSIVLVYRTSRLINFAQGEMATFGAYLAWQFYDWGLPIVLAVAVAVVVSFGFGAGMERVLIRPLNTTSPVAMFIVTLGVLLILVNLEGWIWGYQVKDFPSFKGSTVHLGSAVITRQNLVVVGTVVVVAALLWYLFQRTRFGLAMRGTADNASSARLLGLPVNATLTVSWGLAAAIGTLMASLVAPDQFLQPGMLLSTLLYSFAAAVLGGLDSPPGAIVGGLIVGIAENLVGTYLPGIGQDFKQAVAFVIIMLVLLFRSQGLFGSRTVVRV